MCFKTNQKVTFPLRKLPVLAWSVFLIFHIFRLLFTQINSTEGCLVQLHTHVLILCSSTETNRSRALLKGSSMKEPGWDKFCRASCQQTPFSCGIVSLTSRGFILLVIDSHFKVHKKTCLSLVYWNKWMKLSVILP